MTSDSLERVLITGGAGRIGAYLRSRLARPGRVLRLFDVAPLHAGPGEEVTQGSISDLDALVTACEGVDAVVHLAGVVGEAPWERVLEVNVHGTYCVFEAARQSGVGRVVFASSNHAVGFVARDDGDPAPDYAFPAPDTYYGVSKVAGEALASLYHHRYGMDAVCLRIFSCRDRPTTSRELATWLSPDDAGRLFEVAISAPEPGFRVVWGVSANTRAWFSMREAHALGFFPVDDAEVHAAGILAAQGAPDPSDPVHRFVGGPLTVEALGAVRPPPSPR